jgi:hypothetical protein
MSEIQNVEALEAQVLEIKEEHKRCGARTLKNLDELYKLLNGIGENSEEKSERKAEAVLKPVPQV